MIRVALIGIPVALILSACSSTEPVEFSSPEAAIEAIEAAGFDCPEPDIQPQAADETFSVVDCGRFAIDLIPDMASWEAELAGDCETLNSPDQREVLGEVTVISGPGWLIRSRDYGEVQQWQPGAEPDDFVSAFGGTAESLAQVCERLGGWD
jgi:hypothetical protein